jgi:hypothetical protein
MRRVLWSQTRLWLGIFLLCLPLVLAGQELSKRLILKDGSYQSCTRYEIKGDRVRYLSSERGEWEEIPKSLINWPATEKYEKDRSSGASTPEAAALDKELAEEHAEQEARSPEVVPGLRLPEDGGIFLLDTYNSAAQLVPLEQNNSGQLNPDRKGNILRATINPLAGNKQLVEIKGSHAEVQSHVTVPSIFMSLDLQDPEQAALPYDRFKIVRMQTKGDKRIVGDVKVAVYGKVSQEGNFVPVTTQRMTGGWIKVSPTESLTNGEYAVVEMLGTEGMNLMVWDFGVNPNAGRNTTAWGADPKAQPEPITDQPVQLKKRQDQ